MRWQQERQVDSSAPNFCDWRWAQPGLRGPEEMLEAIDDIGGILGGVGPDGWATPRAVLQKRGADFVVMGECEETLVRLADGERAALPGICYFDSGGIRVHGGPQAARFTDLPALAWPEACVKRHPPPHQDR